MQTNLIIHLKDDSLTPIVNEFIDTVDDQLLIKTSTVMDFVQGALNFDAKGLFYLSNEGARVSFDWQTKWEYHQKKNYSLKREPFAKAIGVKGDNPIGVVDLTCGTGKDTLLLLNFGCRVRAFERQSLIYLLLAFEVYNAKGEFKEVLNSRFNLEFGEITNCELNENDQVLYYDPMYPSDPKKRKAKPRKEMVVFSEIIGADTDTSELVLWALEQDVARVILKRPMKSEKIHNPTASFGEKSTRYDLYSKKKLKN